MVALPYLVKMGSKKETGISHRHQTKLRLPLLHKIAITVEYLPRVLNGEADRESRVLKDSRKWKLD